MAIRIYDWNKKSGKCVVEDNKKTFEFDLYAYDTSNCFFAAVYSYKDTEKHETTKQLQWFCFDEAHMKRMLGLQKRTDGEKENCLDYIRKVTLYKNACKDWRKIMCMFAQAFSKITIEILDEEPKEDKDDTVSSDGEG